MTIEVLKNDLSVCKIENEIDSIKDIYINNTFLFLSKTDKEISLVCETSKTPKNIIKKEEGFNALRINGQLDFSLIGIIADISNILSKNNISVFVISTYDTDYILVKKENIDKAIISLKNCGYDF